MAENSWHRYDMKKLRHCHHMYSDFGPIDGYISEKKQTVV